MLVCFTGSLYCTALQKPQRTMASFPKKCTVENGCGELLLKSKFYYHKGSQSCKKKPEEIERYEKTPVVLNILNACFYLLEMS